MEHLPNQAASELSDLIKLIVDAKACQHRLDAIIAATVKATEARAGADRAQATLAQRVAELDAREAELAKREEANTAERIRLHKHRLELDARDKPYHAAAAELRRLDEALRRRVMQHHHLMPFFNEALQTLPHWQQLEAEIASAAPTNDPAFDNLAEPMQLAAERGEITIGRKSMKRVQA